MGVAEILAAIGVGVVVDAGKDGARFTARTVADEVASEGDAAVMPQPDLVPLWGASLIRLHDAGIIERDQAAIVATLLSARDDELQQIIAALRDDSPTVRARVVYGAVGDAVQYVALPDLPDNGQQWLLDSITAWADPAAVADVRVAIGGNTGVSAGGNAFSVPLGFTAPKAGPVSVPVKLPARTGDKIAVSLAGTANDRAAVVFVYRRG